MGFKRQRFIQGRHPSRGSLYVLEGPDEVGKSTLATALAASLLSKGEPCKQHSFPGREEGTLGALVYELHHDPRRYGVLQMSPASLQILHVAAHADAIARHIEPLLAQGQTVVLDRYWWSTVVYGAVGNVPHEVLEALIRLELTLWQATQPDVVFLIDRPEPFVAVGDAAWWHAVRKEYQGLALRADLPYHVCVVENTSTVSAAVEVMLQHLSTRHGRNPEAGNTAESSK